MPPENFRIGEYELTVGQEAPAGVIRMVRESGAAVGGTMVLQRHPESIEEEICGGTMAIDSLRDQGIQKTTTFERNRTPFIEAIRAMFAHVFSHYDLPRSNGVDFGSGATGAMVETFMNPFIEPSGWAQVEINPAAVAENRRRHPASAIVEGSYHDVAALRLKGCLDMATGLSSLDATHFIGHAVEQLASALRPGGHLLHVQDVRPGSLVGPREMRRMGMDFPFEYENLSRTNMDPLAFKTAEGWLDVGELFRRNLERAILEHTDLELLLSHWLTVRRRIQGAVGRGYFLNMSFALPGYPYEEASAVFTLAKHRARPSGRKITPAPTTDPITDAMREITETRIVNPTD